MKCRFQITTDYSDFWDERPRRSPGPAEGLCPLTDPVAQPLRVLCICPAVRNRAGGGGELQAALHASRVGGSLFSLEWVGEAASPKWGACPPPFHWGTCCPQRSVLETAVGPSCSKLWPRGPLPRCSLPSSQHLWRLRARTQAWGPLSGPRGLPWRGLGLPCPACLLRGSAWVPVSRRGASNPQAVSRLPLSLPSESPLGSTRVALYAPVLFPAMHGADPGLGCLALGASRNPCRCVPNTTQATRATAES